MLNFRKYLWKVYRQSYHLIAVFTLLFGYQSHAQKIYTAGQLFEKGFDAYEKSDNMEAAIFLFAYVQKNPEIMQNNQKHKEQVLAALDYLRGNLVGSDAGASGDDLAPQKPKLDNRNEAPMTKVNLKGIYTIIQKSNGRYVDAHEGTTNYNVVTRDQQSNATQQWIINPMGTNTFTIQQSSTKRYLDAYVDSKDYALVTRDQQKNNTQLWILQEVGKNTYTLQQKSNGRYVDAHEDTRDNALVTRKEQQNDTQRWVVKKSQ